MKNEQVKQIALEKYLNNVPVGIISKELSINPITVVRWMTQLGVYSPSKVRKHEFNERYFKTVDSHTKAYFLGFIFADGGVNLEGRLALNLHKQDVELLNKFSKELGHSVLPKLKGNSACMVIYSKQLTNDLFNLGVTPRKSLTLEFPTKLPEEYLSSFMLGYFDGDGCITGVTGNKPSIKIVSTLPFLKKYQEILVKECGVTLTNIYDKKCPSGLTFSLEYGGKLNVLKIKEFLYKLSPIYLDRKADKFKQLTSDIRTSRR